MRSAARLILFAFLVLATSEPSPGSPSPATWRREILIGTNAEHYFVMVTEWGQKGFYYSAWSAASIEKRRLWDSRIVEDTLVYTLEYRDEDADGGSWDTTATATMPFDLAAYLSSNLVVPAFPCELLPYAMLCEAGLCIEQGGHVATLLTKEELIAQIGEFESIQPLAARYDSRCEMPELSDRPRFFTVRFGYQDSDGDWSELLVTVPGASYVRALEQIRAQRDR